jgi:Putative Actinobacterial Holin-X, holin superfamily III
MPATLYHVGNQACFHDQPARACRPNRSHAPGGPGRPARGTALTAGAAILFFYGWIVALAWIVYLMWGSIPLGTALGAVTAFHVMGGAVLGWVGVRTLKGIRVLRPDDPEAERRERQALSAGIRGTT